MGVGQIAGLIAAIAFAVLAGFMIHPLIRLGKLFDQIADTVRESGEHAIPASMRASPPSSRSTNRLRMSTGSPRVVHCQQRRRPDRSYGSFLGKPVIKIASFFYALKSTAQSFVAKKSTDRDSVEGSGQQESKAQ